MELGKRSIRSAFSIVHLNVEKSLVLQENLLPTEKCMVN